VVSVVWIAPLLLPVIPLMIAMATGVPAMPIRPTAAYVSVAAVSVELTAQSLLVAMVLVAVVMARFPRMIANAPAQMVLWVAIARCLDAMGALAVAMVVWATMRLDARVHALEDSVAKIVLFLRLAMLPPTAAVMEPPLTPTPRMAAPVHVQEASVEATAQCPRAALAMAATAMAA
jgi:hypothetical protein